MEKAFVWDPVMRSSAIKYDPCISEDGKRIKCEDCKITIIADRFLGKEFQQEILGKMGKSRGRYPFVIIADALGCNLRCWFCYAYKFFDKKTAELNRCQISYVSPKRLAEQFKCKIEKLSDFDGLIKSAESKKMDANLRKVVIKHLQMKMPLMRLRISGGEPIFSTRDTLHSTKPDLVSATVDYWLAFFEELDSMVGKLKEEKKLHIIDKEKVMNKEWKGDLPFPTCLAERSDRLNIRFDTNGILFGDLEVTEHLIGGLFRLFEKNKLQNIFVQIDYSFKGATPVEYEWSQRRNLPVDQCKISFDYDLEKHPQIPGYLNIVNTIEKYCSKNHAFYNCIGITVERGINHNPSFKTYLNCIESLNWEKFSEKTGIKFSVVDNPVELFNWRSYGVKSSFIKNGGSVKIISGQDTFDLKDNPDMNSFEEFRMSHPDCCFIVYPVEETLKLREPSKVRRVRPPSGQTRLVEFPIFGWVLSGSQENWDRALETNMWGVKVKHRNLWEKVNQDDIVFIYVTNPISRIVGYAKVRELKEGDSPVWSDEIAEGRVKYPLRILFSSTKCLPKKEWIHGIKPYGIEIGHGINPIRNEPKVKGLVNQIDSLIENAGSN